MNLTETFSEDDFDKLVTIMDKIGAVLDEIEDCNTAEARRLIDEAGEMLADFVKLKTN